jgi:exopolysaccharide biosynthesis polyprenyl glycosylphosphotransferase
MQMEVAIDPVDVRPLRVRINPAQMRFQLYLLLILVDQIVIAGSFVGATLVRSQQWLAPAGVQLIYLLSPVYFILALTTDAYSRDALVNSGASVRRALTAMMTAIVVILAAIFFFKASEDVSRLGIGISLFASAALLGIERRLFVGAVRRYSRSELIAQLAIIDNIDASELTPGSGYDIIRASDFGISADVDDPYMMHRLGSIVAHYDRVVVYCCSERRAAWALVLKGANVTGEIIAPGLRGIGAVAIGKFGSDNTLVVARGPLSISARAQKRVFDLAFTVPILIALLPLLIVVAIAIKLDSAGPVFFRQSRIGRGNRMFQIYKFRSMRAETADSAGRRSAARDDDRITRVGGIIRKTSIDELPQLINVLLGDMSLVGPRPHALGSLAGDQLFWEVDREYWCRHALKPGITGLAQVRGYRGATNHREDLQNRLDADLEYLNGWSLMRDVGILFSTVRVLVHRNAY